MYYRGFAENKRVYRSSIAALVEEFCNEQGKRYDEPCFKPHTESQTCSVHEFSRENLRRAFETMSSDTLADETPFCVAHEYDMETEVCRPVDTCPSHPIALRHPFVGPPLFEEIARPRPPNEPTIPYFLRGRRAANFTEPIVLDDTPMAERGQVFKDHYKCDSEEEGAYSETSKDKTGDTLELDTIMEEAEGDEQQCSDWQTRSAKLKDPKIHRAMRLRAFNNYRFAEINPMLDLEDPFREAMRKMREGSLTMAIIYLEASVQRRPAYTYPKNSIAWLFLGLCRAANDQDVQAIAAFRECLKIDPKNPNALIGIAISYANEDRRNLVVEAIWNWLYNEPKYREVDEITLPQDVRTMYEPLDIDIHSKVLRMLLMVLYKYKGGFIDVNLHTAMAIMYALIGDHTRSVRYFNIAALLCPKDERLWNRLGASLANYKKHREAIHAYANAIALVPGYVRARFNWAISCRKLGAYGDGTKQLVTALHHQKKAVGGLSGKTSDSIWLELQKLVRAQKKPRWLRAVKRRDLKFLVKIFGVEP